MVSSPSMPSDPTETILHASAVEVGGNALVILGGSGTGKSALALELIALGAKLVADDRTIVRQRDGKLFAAAPASIAGRVEARYIGLLRLPYTDEARLILAIDLDHTEGHRLPPKRSIALLGQTVTLLYRSPAGHSAPALLQCLKMRRTDP